MDSRCLTYYDENLRDVPMDLSLFKEYVHELEDALTKEKDEKKALRLKGEFAVRLRTLGELDRAEELLFELLSEIKEKNLGIQWEIQQQIRLGHVLQWKLLFKESNEIFDIVLKRCRENADASIYLDFALQHIGKNLFEQERYVEALSFFEEALKIRLEKASPQDQMESTRYAIRITKQLI